MTDELMQCDHCGEIVTLDDILEHRRCTIRGCVEGPWGDSEPSEYEDVCPECGQQPASFQQPLDPTDAEILHRVELVAMQRAIAEMRRQDAESKAELVGEALLLLGQGEAMGKSLDRFRDGVQAAIDEFGDRQDAAVVKIGQGSYRRAVYPKDIQGGWLARAWAWLARKVTT